MMTSFGLLAVFIYYYLDGFIEDQLLRPQAWLRLEPTCDLAQQYIDGSDHGRSLFTGAISVT